MATGFPAHKNRGTKLRSLLARWSAHMTIGGDRVSNPQTQGHIGEKSVGQAGDGSDQQH